MFPVKYEFHLHIKSKAVPVTGGGNLWSCKMLSIPRGLDSRLSDGGNFVSLM
jgi:hypothetical protein